MLTDTLVQVRVDINGPGEYVAKSGSVGGKLNAPNWKLVVLAFRFP